MKARARRAFAWLGGIVVSLLVGSAGCGPVDEPVGSGTCEQPPDPEPPADAFRDDSRHWIGTEPTGNCSTMLPNWVGRRLFAGSIVDVDTGSNVDVGGELSTYCAYMWVGPDSPSAPPDWVRDRRGLTPQASSATEWASAAFLAGIHGVVPAPADADPRVRVLVWDTEKNPADEDEPSAVGTNMHGRVMKDLVEKVACPPSGPCAVQVQTQMAMPRARLNGEETLVDNGGDFGRMSDLAVAVSRSLEIWRTELSDDQSPFPETLIGSMSFAFEWLRPDAPADAAVLKVLKAASCHEVLMFAASGNHASQSLTGLPYPAAWQDELQPSSSSDGTPDECDDLLGQEFMTALEKVYLQRTGHDLHRAYDGTEKPHLLHAIGGLDQGGKVISNAREMACPRFAAQGLAWGAPEEETDMLFTGSSVPTALIAAITAAGLAQSASLTKHPRTFLDDPDGVWPLVEFGAHRPCGTETEPASWSCKAPVRWIGGPPSGPGASQNPKGGFPLSEYSSSSVRSAHLVSSCEREPLCVRPVVSAIGLVYPQPEAIPCARPCVFEISPGEEVSNPAPLFHIQPTMTLTYAMLRIEAGDGSGEAVFKIASGSDELKEGIQYTFALDPGALQGIDLSSARVTFSSLTASAGTSVVDQVLIVE